MAKKRKQQLAICWERARAIFGDPDPPGQVWEQQFEFFRDSLIQRIDAEPVAISPSPTKHPWSWLCRFNSLGFIIPRIGAIWEPWWSIETRGRAIAVLKYCSGLTYFEGENKLFGIDTRLHGWIGPNLLENDGRAHEQGWLAPNVKFLRDTLSFDYVLQKVEEAARRLAGEPEHLQLAEQELADIMKNRELVESRIAELPAILADGEQTKNGWSI